MRTLLGCGGNDRQRWLAGDVAGLLDMPDIPELRGTEVMGSSYWDGYQEGRVGALLRDGGRGGEIRPNARISAENVGHGRTLTRAQE